MDTDGYAPAERRWQERQGDFFRWLPHVLLAIVTLGVILADDQRTGTPSLLILAGVTAAWEALWWTRPRRWLARAATIGTPRPSPAGRTPPTDYLYLGGLWVLGATLVLAHPLYGFFVWFLFVRMFDLLRGAPRWVAVLLVAALISWSQVGAPVQMSTAVVGIGLALLAMNGGIAVAMLKFTEVSERHEQQRREALGALEASNQQLQQALAENAGLHAQLLVQAHDAGVQGERERFAGEVHDTIAQGLAGIVTQLEALERATSPEEQHRRMTRAKEIARRSLAEARRSLDAVGPERLEHARLPDAVRELTATWAIESGIAAHAEVTGTPRVLVADIEVALYRAVQEALTNVAKHARATRTVVTLSYTDTDLLLDVRDDGCGSDAADRSRGAGFGLRSMRQRVATSGGHVTIESEPGAGTTVSVVIPIRPLTLEGGPTTGLGTELGTGLGTKLGTKLAPAPGTGLEESA